MRLFSSAQPVHDAALDAVDTADRVADKLTEHASGVADTVGSRLAKVESRLAKESLQLRERGADAIAGAAQVARERPVATSTIFAIVALLVGGAVYYVATNNRG